MPTYVDLLFQALDAEPDTVAFAWDGGSVTYAEAAVRIARIAHAFRAAGLREGDGVAMLSTNHPEAFLLMAGALTAGCRYTPLHPLGSAADHSAVLERAQVSAFLFEEEVYGEHVKAMAHLPDLVWAVGGLPYDSQPSTRPAVDIGPDDLAFLPFTGGTTGVPKGVMLPHRVLVTNAVMTLAGWDLPARPRYLAVTPVSHAAGVIVIPVLLRGGTVILQRRFSLDEFVANVEKFRPNMTFLVPAIIYALLDASVDLSGFETVVYGAAAMSPERLAEAIELFGPIFMQLYGQTEAPNTVTALRRDDHTPATLATCGRPVPGNAVRLLGQDGAEVAVGEVGEICVRGPLVMAGYWREPELTAETLRDGWLHTGDLARRDERGYITIVDRVKDMVVTGGFNVYSREVEDVLAQHPAVAQVAVVGVPDPRWGEAVTAVVVARVSVPAEELIAFVKERKGPVHAPKNVHFVDALPLTALAKPDKKALRLWLSCDQP